jgi:hypothetical protein
MSTYITSAPEQPHRFTYTLRPESFAGQVLGGLAAVAAVVQAVYLLVVGGFLLLLLLWTR